MIPFFFGATGKEKYGVFHAATGAGSKGRGIVFCDALFDEAIRAHRALRYASDSLAAARWSSFRFDYFATGDSMGDTAEFELAQASRDVHEAVEEAKSMAALSSVYLLGLRLGGTLAMNCAVDRQDIRGVVLWDPIVDGETVVEEFRELAEPDTNGSHLGGYIFEDSLQDELMALSMRNSVSRFKGPILMICTAPTKAHYDLAKSNPSIDMRVVEAPEAWLRDSGGGVKPIPAAVIRQIKSWQG